MLRDVAEDPFLSTFSISPHTGAHVSLLSQTPSLEQHTNQSGPSLINMDFIERTNSKLVRCHTPEASRTTRMKKQEQKTPPKQNEKKHPSPNCLKIKVSVDQRILKKHIVAEGGETPMPEQGTRVEGKTTQKFKPTVPAHRPPTLSRARQRASQLFFFLGGGDTIA